MPKILHQPQYVLLLETANFRKTHDSVYCAPDGLQFCYNVCSCVGTSLIVCYFVWYCDNVCYSMDCLNSRNLFGCVGLRNKEYCIFNRQYSKEEYEQLAVRLIRYLQQTGEWGEFFPFRLAPCAYNETVAQEYFPLQKEAVLKLGALWKEPEDDTVQGAQSFSPPADIRDVDDAILSEVLRCETTGRRYRILPAELAFYKKMKVPIPKRHPDQRHYDRLELHNFY